MKSNIFKFIVALGAAIACLFLASCNKEEIKPNPLTESSRASEKSLDFLGGLWYINELTNVGLNDLELDYLNINTDVPAYADSMPNPSNVVIEFSLQAAPLPSWFIVTNNGTQSIATITDLTIVPGTDPYAFVYEITLQLGNGDVKDLVVEVTHQNNSSLADDMIVIGAVTDLNPSWGANATAWQQIRGLRIN